MRFRQLGSSDLKVSEICLGSWLTYGGGVADDRAEACVAKAFELGINFIDTANVYAAGRAEEFLGNVLAGRPRDSYILATKLFGPMPDGGAGLSREQVHTQIDASLRRLRTDYVDLYQCHRYDWGTPLDETMEALTEVVRAGKARWLGFSEWPADKIEEAVRIHRAEGASRPGDGGSAAVASSRGVERGQRLYAETDVEVAAACETLARYGIAPRHLRAFRTAADRESGLLEALVAPALRSRNAERRRAGIDDLQRLAETAQELSQLLFSRNVRRLAE